ncbi:MAG: DUF1460 domain-containing protein [Myxococcales bacterium]|nr:DUF1460 domain-containing protein [Myxococcales bacterium]
MQQVFGWSGSKKATQWIGWGLFLASVWGLWSWGGQVEARSRRLSLMRLVYRVRTGSATFQRRTAQQIRRQAEVRAWPMLVGLLRMPEAGMRRGGAIALGELEIPWSGALLHPLVQDADEGVRLAAIEALGAIRDRSAVKLLLPVASSSSRKQAMAALEALARIGDASVLGELEGWTSAQQARVGIAYSLALASLGHDARRQRWEAYWKRAPQKALRHLARWRALWASGFLFARYQETPSLRASIASALLQRVSPERSKFLSERCGAKELPDRFCQGAVRRYQEEILPVFPSIPKPLFLMPKEAAAAWLRGLHKRYPDPSKRFTALTQRMLGTSYVLDALGEGPKGRYDRDPIFSLSKLDCVTFLEQAMAMNQRTQLQEAISFTQKLRYIDGKIAYDKRKHFPLLQWIPMMVRDGFALDITQKLGRAQTRRVTKQLSLQSYQWTREGRMMMQRLGKENLIFGEHHLSYLPLDIAVRRAKQIPNGTILSVLVPRPATSPFQIVHQGVVVWVDGQPYMRHATKVWKSIVDMPLISYLQSLRRYRKPRLGIHLLQVRMELPPHLSQAPAP